VDSTQRKQLVDALISYGLNEYEGKAYLALLQYGPAVAGDISRRSGIPRPRVYDTLQRLIDASLVSESGGTPKSYAPLPLEEFLRNMSSEFRRRQDLLRSNLAQIQPEDCKAGVFHIHDEAPIARQIEDLIGAARSQVTLCIHSQDANLVANAIEDAIQRGVVVEGSFYGPPDARFSSRLKNLPASENSTFTGGRRLLICRDNEEILVAHFGGSERPYAVRTRNRLLIDELGSSLKDTARDGNGHTASLSELVQA
jgi:sugar-specific transcriptional regulator TrmB